MQAMASCQSSTPEMTSSPNPHIHNVESERQYINGELAQTSVGPVSILSGSSIDNNYQTSDLVGRYDPAETVLDEERCFGVTNVVVIIVAVSILVFLAAIVIGIIQNIKYIPTLYEKPPPLTANNNSNIPLKLKVPTAKHSNVTQSMSSVSPSLPERQLNSSFGRQKQYLNHQHANIPQQNNKSVNVPNITHSNDKTNVSIPQGNIDSNQASKGFDDYQQNEQQKGNGFNASQTVTRSLINHQAIQQNHMNDNDKHNNPNQYRFSNQHYKSKSDTNTYKYTSYYAITPPSPTNRQPLNPFPNCDVYLKQVIPPTLNNKLATQNQLKAVQKVQQKWSQMVKEDKAAYLQNQQDENIEIQKGKANQAQYQTHNQQESTQNQTQFETSKQTHNQQESTQNQTQFETSNIKGSDSHNQSQNDSLNNHNK